MGLRGLLEGWLYLYTLILYKNLNLAAWVQGPSDLPLLAELVPTFADRRYRVISETDPYGCILGILDRSRYFFLQVAP
jgi:hypothetical protein